MKRIHWRELAACIIVGAAASCASEHPPGNVIPETRAQTLALAQVPGATVKSHELEREGGRWIYSYDLEVRGQEGVEEIHVDALTGEVLAHEHEGAGVERREEEDEAGEEASGAPSNPATVRTPYAPDIEADEFADRIDNPFFPLVPGTALRYASTDGGETGTVTVTDRTRTVMGITATVVLDQVYSDGELAEETYDWYAQDEEGNVWYMGEDSRELEGGQVTSTAGSWEAGRDGALPGIIMLAQPAVGQRYRQEYLEGEAADIGKVLELGVSVTTPYGSFQDCIRTENTTPLEPRVRETKVYCRGVGLVLENEGPGSRNELVAVERN